METIITRFYACMNPRCSDKAPNKIVRYTVSNQRLTACPTCKGRVELEREFPSTVAGRVTFQIEYL